MPQRLLLVCLLVIPLAPTAARVPRDQSVQPLPLTELVLATAAGSGQPFLSVTPSGDVLASWLERTGSGKTRFRFARFDGVRWSEPRTIAEGGDFFVNWADVPSIVELAGGDLAAHWLQKSGPGTYAYDVRVSRSADGGRTWSAPVVPHRDGTPTEHGFASLYDAGAGRLGLVWLDGRNTGGGEGHGHGGAMTLRSAALERDGTIADEQLVDDRVCDCCPTAAAVVGADVLVAYRDRSDGGEVRDISLARRAAGAAWLPGTAPADRWEMPACPVNGPVLAVSGGRVSLAWFTAEGNVPRVSLAQSSDGGRTFGSVVRVDDASTLGRVSAAHGDDGRTVVGWIEFTDPGAEFRVRAIDAEGRRGRSWRVTALGSDRSSGYPRLVQARGRLILAWTDRTMRVRTAAAALPPS